ncbi:unnamed protein product [Amoebophrya sp. A25]|nr:unnamed protein product [Amoebophrya sp. A25]|eukprot:GSA25T00011548001.1
MLSRNHDNFAAAGATPSVNQLDLQPRRGGNLDQHAFAAVVGHPRSGFLGQHANREQAWSWMPGYPGTASGTHPNAQRLQSSHDVKEHQTSTSYMEELQTGVSPSSSSQVTTNMERNGKAKASAGLYSKRQRTGSELESIYQSIFTSQAVEAGQESDSDSSYVDETEKQRRKRKAANRGKKNTRSAGGAALKSRTTSKMNKKASKDSAMPSAPPSLEGLTGNINGRGQEDGSARGVANTIRSPSGGSDETMGNYRQEMNVLGNATVYEENTGPETPGSSSSTNIQGQPKRRGRPRKYPVGHPRARNPRDHQAEHEVGFSESLFSSFQQIQVQQQETAGREFDYFEGTPGPPRSVTTTLPLPTARIIEQIEHEKLQQKRVSRHGAQSGDGEADQKTVLVEKHGDQQNQQQVAGEHQDVDGISKSISRLEEPPAASASAPISMHSATSSIATRIMERSRGRIRLRSGPVREYEEGHLLPHPRRERVEQVGEEQVREQVLEQGESEQYAAHHTGIGRGMQIMSPIDEDEEENAKRETSPRLATVAPAEDEEDGTTYSTNISQASLQVALQVRGAGVGLGEVEEVATERSTLISHNSHQGNNKNDKQEEPYEKGRAARRGIEQTTGGRTRSSSDDAENEARISIDQKGSRPADLGRTNQSRGSTTGDALHVDKKSYGRPRAGTTAFRAASSSSSTMGPGAAEGSASTNDEPKAAVAPLTRRTLRPGYETSGVVFDLSFGQNGLSIQNRKMRNQVQKNEQGGSKQASSHATQMKLKNTAEAEAKTLLGYREEDAVNNSSNRASSSSVNDHRVVSSARARVGKSLQTGTSNNTNSTTTPTAHSMGSGSTTTSSTRKREQSSSTKNQMSKAASATVFGMEESHNGPSFIEVEEKPKSHVVGESQHLVQQREVRHPEEEESCGQLGQGIDTVSMMHPLEQPPVHEFAPKLTRRQRAILEKKSSLRNEHILQHFYAGGGPSFFEFDQQAQAHAQDQLQMQKQEEDGDISVSSGVQEKLGDSGVSSCSGMEIDHEDDEAIQAKNSDGTEQAHVKKHQTLLARGHYARALPHDQPSPSRSSRSHSGKPSDGRNPPTLQGRRKRSRSRARERSKLQENVNREKQHAGAKLQADVEDRQGEGPRAADPRSSCGGRSVDRGEDPNKREVDEADQDDDVDEDKRKGNKELLNCRVELTEHFVDAFRQYVENLPADRLVTALRPVALFLSENLEAADKEKLNSLLADFSKVQERESSQVTVKTNGASMPGKPTKQDNRNLRSKISLQEEATNQVTKEQRASVKGDEGAAAKDNSETKGIFRQKREQGRNRKRVTTRRRRMDMEDAEQANTKKSVEEEEEENGSHHEDINSTDEDDADAAPVRKAKQQMIFEQRMASTKTRAASSRDGGEGEQHYAREIIVEDTEKNDKTSSYDMKMSSATSSKRIHSRDVAPSKMQSTASTRSKHCESEVPVAASEVEIERSSSSSEGEEMLSPRKSPSAGIAGSIPPKGPVLPPQSHQTLPAAPAASSSSSTSTYASKPHAAHAREYLGRPRPSSDKVKAGGAYSTSRSEQDQNGAAENRGNKQDIAYGVEHTSAHQDTHQHHQSTSSWQHPFLSPLKQTGPASSIFPSSASASTSATSKNVYDSHNRNNQQPAPQDVDEAWRQMVLHIESVCLAARCGTATSSDVRKATAMMHPDMLRRKLPDLAPERIKQLEKYRERLDNCAVVANNSSRSSTSNVQHYFHHTSAPTGHIVPGGVPVAHSQPGSSLGLHQIHAAQHAAAAAAGFFSNINMMNGNSHSFGQYVNNINDINFTSASAGLPGPSPNNFHQPQPRINMMTKNMSNMNSANVFLQQQAVMMNLTLNVRYEVRTLGDGDVLLRLEWQLPQPAAGQTVEDIFPVHVYRIALVVDENLELPFTVEATEFNVEEQKRETVTCWSCRASDFTKDIQDKFLTESDVIAVLFEAEDKHGRRIGRRQRLRVPLQMATT